MHRQLRIVLCTAALIVAWRAAASGDEPPALNPFGPTPATRDDALPGRVELSDGSVHAGMIHLTRDKRLQIYDQQAQRQREVPLQAVRRIECAVKWERLERQWKFKETTSDEKLYTGRSYPAREYVHTITLRDGRTISGPLAAIVYVEPPDERSPRKTEQFLLHKRDKGELGQTLESLIFVKRIVFGPEAMTEGKKLQ